MRANSLNEIADKINKMTFRKKLFGGVDEADVWRLIRELDADYQNIFKLQNNYYKLRLKKLERAYSNEEIKKSV